MKNFEKISNKLNELLIKNYDAEQGYIKAMHNVENDSLKSFFTERSEDRGRFASQIRTQILRFGETPKESGSFTGTMHRNWMEFKTLFTSNDEKVILEEILRGEKASLEDYNEIISETDIPENIKTVLVSHRNSIKNVINNVPKLEQAVA
ncbi:ferritin-like domain-containing protein [Gillisia hiemivivida]|uniref:PA2169 family four-helix-bundle protein n=2 Tax=Gillisia hiemivivida TaxID=291190 RepID=A0A5C6ZV58_9FLAO|nr:PA2169 family four-helix-bundle protein [Gillisia hiemivivida]TXD93815.1 PA2169 family four-helix-bundle protein [Gillisia hiemivivida]